MTDTAERRIWRTSPVLIVVVALFCAGGAGAAWHLYSESGMNTLAGVFAAFSALCILRIADAWHSRIEINGPELKYRVKLRKGHFIAPMIDRVRIADNKLYLILVDGEAVLLPDLGLNPRNIGGVIHAWLKKHNPVDEDDVEETEEVEEGAGAEEGARDDAGKDEAADAGADADADVKPAKKTGKKSKKSAKKKSAGKS